MNPQWSVENFRIKNWIIKYEKKGIKNICYIILNDDDNDNIFSEIFNQNKKNAKYQFMFAYKDENDKMYNFSSKRLFTHPEKSQTFQLIHFFNCLTS